VMRGRAGA